MNILIMRLTFLAVHRCGGLMCGEGAVCVNFKCVCPMHFYGDGQNGCVGK